MQIVAGKAGTLYGQCSEICGANHAFMPIRLEVSQSAGLYPADAPIATPPIQPETRVDAASYINFSYKGDPITKAAKAALTKPSDRFYFDPNGVVAPW